MACMVVGRESYVISGDLIARSLLTKVFFYWSVI